MTFCDVFLKGNSSDFARRVSFLFGCKRQRWKDLSDERTNSQRC